MADNSKTAIVAALIGNIAVAAVKFLAFAVGGSSAMLTEAVHSLVDTMNQLVLLFGRGMARKPPDENHPFGHGLEVYFYTFIVALLIFLLGGAVGIYEGVRKVIHPEPIGHAWLNVGVIAVSFVLEGLSLSFGLKAARRSTSPVIRRILPTLNVVELMHYSKDPGIYEVLAEDSAAILGLLFALVGVVAAAWFGVAWADGAASIAIGLLLMAVAGFLVMETKSLLTGEAAAPQVVDEVRRVLDADHRILAVCEIQSMHLGPQDILVAATIDFHDDLTGPQLEKAADELTERLKAAEPRITRVFLRPGEAVWARSDGTRKGA
jgi:cation diffusion facilitator family transporter